MPYKTRDITGKRFSKLVVIGLSHRDKQGTSYWDCLCDCGGQITTRYSSLTSSNAGEVDESAEHALLVVTSCGCYQRQLASVRIKQENVRRTLPNGVASQRDLFRQYKKSAVARGLIFELPLSNAYKIDFSDINQDHLPIQRALPMTPTFEPEFVTLNLFPVLRDEVAWVNRSAPRDECFMASANAPQSYSYGNNNETREALHTYHAVEMHPAVLSIMEKLNQRGTEYNVCVLNYYKDRFQHLGWHADDSPEQDLQHPIAVISFGAERYLYTKKRGDKGDVPESGKYLMTQGGLFVMPGGYQDTHLHKIPKHHTECDGRISLTFRKLVR